jgi:hypothetical protein
MPRLVVWGRHVACGGLAGRHAFCKDSTYV